MEKFSVVIFILTVLVSLSALIEKIKIPHPVFLVAAGLGIGFIPVLPELVLNPEVIFIVFLPPLLYDAAYRTSWRDFKSDIRPISALAVSLVFFTTLTVGLTAYWFIPSFTLPLAFLLGAIISPPDAIASTGIIKGLSLNKRVITILEGESLVNDASALIAYRYALLAVSTGSFIFWGATLQFLLVTGGGILIGIAIGYLLIFVHAKIINSPVVETSLTLLTPFLSYLAAEKLHASGILSVVCTGLLISWHSHELFSSRTRMQAVAVWETLMFLMNGFVFVIIGMQLPAILQQMKQYTLWELTAYGVAISFVTILVRVIWVFAGAYLAKLFPPKTAADDALSFVNDEKTIWKNVLIISWTGTRGIISLAAALALPLTLQDGTAFPQRAMILFLCFFVIFITLVVQGLSLKPLILLLQIKPAIQQGIEKRELQLYIANRTIDFINENYSSGKGLYIKEELKKKYENLARLLALQGDREGVAGKNENTLPTNPGQAIEHARSEIRVFQRDVLLALHKEGFFSNKAIHEVEDIMDIDELQFEQHVANPASKNL